MLRVYSPSGQSALMGNALNLGGHVDCLAPDSSGGCFAILGAADPGQIAYIQSLGVIVLPTNLTAAMPAAIPAAAYASATTAPVTVNDLMTVIYAGSPLPNWHPDFT